MLTVQACQQNPNNAKSFPAATVPAAAKLGHRRGKRGISNKESRNARRSHASKQKSRLGRSRGVVGVLHPTRRKNQGGNLGRKPGTERTAEGTLPEKATEEAGDEEGRPHEAPGRQGKVSTGRAHVRHF